jgi:hypothetical protein
MPASATHSAWPVSSGLANESRLDRAVAASTSPVIAAAAAGTARAAASASPGRSSTLEGMHAQ